ncbi:MAG: hypothetical protein GYB65_15105 [Chloroflexi bacterium]|nr:hypothetical protein [Chloroflexota bacterium]
MNMLRLIRANGCVPLVPLLLWNIFFTSQLPSEISSGFDEGIPTWILLGESVFRIAIFALPIFVRINISTPVGRRGLVVFLAGTVVYFAAWIPLMVAPD